MARLQILELPEGTGDDRPPFVLVVDEIKEDEGEAFFQSQEATNGFASKVGARALVAFHGVTIDIPANEAVPVAVDSVEGDAQTGELIHAHEQTRLALCDALLLSLDTTWHKLIEQVGERQRELAGLYRQLDRVRDLAEHPEIMDAKHEQPQGYLHGYRIAIRAAKRAARADRPQAAENGG